MRAEALHVDHEANRSQHHVIRKRAVVKRKYSDRGDWARILARRYSQERLETPDFDGIVTLLCMDAVTEPLDVFVHEEWVRIVDAGYSWTQHFSARTGDEHVALTTMFDATGRVVEWYLDVVRRHGVDERGVPWYDDLYLDVVATPTGQLALLDEDELDDALRDGRITAEEHALAWREATRLLALLRDRACPLLEQAAVHRELLLQRGERP